MTWSSIQVFQKMYWTKVLPSGNQTGSRRDINSGVKNVGTLQYGMRMFSLGGERPGWTIRLQICIVRIRVCFSFGARTSSVPGSIRYIINYVSITQIIVWIFVHRWPKYTRFNQSTDVAIAWPNDLIAALHRKQHTLQIERSPRGGHVLRFLMKIPRAYSYRYGK